MGKPSTPAQPDYTKAAQAQGQANVEAARTSSKLSNPNIITPYGSQTVQYGTAPTFDQSGYDQAMADYQKQLDAYNSQQQPIGDSSVFGGQNYWNNQSEGGGGFSTGNLTGSQLSMPTAPNKDSFYKSDQDVPTVTQTLSPEYQNIFNAQTQNQLGLQNLAGQGIQNVGGVLGSQFNPNLPQMPINPGTTATQAMLSRIEPQLAQSRELNASTLANQGITQGSEAYNNAMRLQQQQENDLRLQAAAAGIPMDFQANQQAYQQALANRELPLNEISALMSGGQVQAPQFQQFQGTPVTPSPVFGGAQAQGQAANNIYNSQVGSYNNMMGGLFGLGSAGLGAYGLAAMSDRRLKKNVKLIGKWKGFNLYDYDYIWGEHSMGVMADEVEKSKPEAVTVMPDGFKAVYYGLL